MTRTIVRNPASITTGVELSEIIKALEKFKHDTGEEPAVVKQQNRSLGSSYFVVPLTEAQELLGKWRDSERYTQVWPKGFFYNLQTQYSERKN